MYPDWLSDNGAARSARESFTSSGPTDPSGVLAPSSATVFGSATTNFRTGNRDATSSLGSAMEGLSSDLGPGSPTQTRENRVRVNR